MGNTVRITGVDKVIAKVKVLQGLYPTQVDSALMYGATCIEGRAKEICPVDTGRLKGSITTHAGETEDGNRHEVCVGTNVEYAPYVEFGTRKMNPKPYLRPAFDETKESAVQRIADKLKGELLK